jgi:hypothetical protein
MSGGTEAEILGYESGREIPVECLTGPWKAGPTLEDPRFDELEFNRHRLVLILLEEIYQ